MITTTFTSEVEAIDYIKSNEQYIFGELSQDEIKTIYTNENTRITAMKDGKRLLMVTIRFQGDKYISSIYKDMADLKLL